MTVADLRKKLSRLPDDAELIFHNDHDYEDNLYAVGRLSYWKCNNQVEIRANYKKKAKNWVREVDKDGNVLQNRHKPNIKSEPAE